MSTTIVDGVVYSTVSEHDDDRRSAFQLIKDCLNMCPEKMIAVDSCQSLTSRDFLIKIQRCAARFHQEGVGLGCRVCAYIHNTVDNMAAALAVLSLGGTLILAKSFCIPRELMYIIQDSNSSFVLTDDKGASTVLEINGCHLIEKLFAAGDVPGFINVCRFDDLQNDASKTCVTLNSAETVMVISYTTGSTGLPKGVEITHKAYVSMYHAFRRAAYCTEDDVYLAWNPLTHVSGLTTNVFFMCFGGTVVLKEPNLTFEECLDSLKRYKVTALAGSPLKMQQVINEARERKQQLPTVSKFLIGGSILSKTLRDDICNAFNPQTLVNLYALTETCGVVTTTPAGSIAENNCGRPDAGCKVKVVDPSTDQVFGPFQHGEIVIQSKSMMKGYYGCPEVTAAVLSSDGWLRTGDLGYYDNDGCLYIVERLKDMIKCLGNQLAPAEIEEILLTHAAVKEAVVVGVPSAKYGEAPAACIVLKDAVGCDTNALQAELKQLVAGQAAAHKHLHGGMIFAESIPKAEHGKILRKEVTSMILTQLMTP
ncbi:unnamed protein product [Ixodes persulcatus]